MAASRSAVCNCRPIWRCASGSRNRTINPVRGCVPPGSVSSRSTESSTEALPGKPVSGMRRFANANSGVGRFVNQKTQVGGGRKNFGNRLAGKSGAVAARNLSTEPEANTRRRSRLKTRTASSRSRSKPSMLPAQVGNFELRAAQAFSQQAHLEAMMETSSFALPAVAGSGGW